MPPARARHFGSDNYAGICPEAWAALAQANAAHAVGYGDDPWTERAVKAVKELLEADCEVFFVFNGTAANALSLAALGQPYHSILCHEVAHVATDEAGAPHFFTGGMKVHALAGAHGKLDPAAVERAARARTDVHHSLARAVSVTQSTELGTVYAPDELRAISAAARRLGLLVHMDGARLANAVAGLGVAPREITWQAGVDVLSLGGTKDGLAVGEAVVFFDRELAREFAWRRKQGGQLASKMRFVTAPWAGLLESGAWLRNARHANAMAERMEAAVRTIPGVTVIQPRQANAVFAAIPGLAVAAMHAAGWHFYDFAAWGGARLMCSWDTTPDDVDAFAADLRVAMAAR